MPCYGTRRARRQSEALIVRLVSSLQGTIDSSKTHCRLTAFSLSSASFFACLTLFSFLDTHCEFTGATSAIRYLQSSIFWVEEAFYGSDLSRLFRFSLPGGEYC